MVSNTLCFHVDRCDFILFLKNVMCMVCVETCSVHHDCSSECEGSCESRGGFKGSSSATIMTSSVL